MVTPRPAPLLALQKGIVYGPVRSRRLGVSLGLNVLPERGKVCTFDCAYCQYGWTRPDVMARLAEVRFPEVAEVLAAVEGALVAAPEPPAYLTFSGNGEATLHPDFGALVDGVGRLRDRLAPGARVAILSNATTIGDPGVRAALERLDVRILKLDVGTEAAFRRFCRPLTAVTLDEVVAGLAALPGVTLQSLFCGGPGGNAAPAEVAAWARRVRQVAPRAVQVYTVARGYPSREIEPLDRARLEEIAASLQGMGARVDVF